VRGCRGWRGSCCSGRSAATPAKVENPEKGSFWIGEGQTDNPGRGSTFDAVLGDEFAFVEHAEKVYAALDDACPQGKALLSTVNGEQTAHARLAKTRPKGKTYLRLHWSTHPVYSVGLHAAARPDMDADGKPQAQPVQPSAEAAAIAAGCVLCARTRAGVPWDPSEPRSHRYPGKLTSPWYDERVIGKTNEQVASELDIDREGAKSHRVYPEFSSAVHVVADGIPYEPEFHHLLELALDPGLDMTSVIVFQDMPTELRVIGTLEAGHLVGTSGVAANVATALIEYLRSLGVEDRVLTFEHTRHIYGIADPAAHNPETSSGKSYVQELRRMGFNFGKPPSRLCRTVAPSISSVKLLLGGYPKPLRICGVKAAAFAEHARENTWRISPDGRVLGLNDDVHNHMMRAAAYYALAKFPSPSKPQPPHGGDGEPVDDEGTPRAQRRARREGVHDPGIRMGMSF